MRFFRTSAGVSVQVGIKLARLLELPEADFEKRVRELESDAGFRRLLDAQVVSIQPYEGARFASRHFGGWGLRTSTDGVAALLDGQGDIAHLLHRVGQNRFEKCFLRDEGYTDEERGKMCAISTGDAARLRELVNSLYVAAEFDSSSSTSAPPKTYSTVAGISVDDGRPVLAFFNREIWKGRYKVDEAKREQMLGSMQEKDAQRLKKFLRDLELLDRRKTTLYRVLELLVETQGPFFISGDPAQRRALTQRTVSEKLDISPSVLNRLISNKSVQLPWGLEAPLKVLVPSRKGLLRDRLHDLIKQHPDATDAALGRMLENLYGVRLLRSSLAQYRVELGLGGSRQRRR